MGSGSEGLVGNECPTPGRESCLPHRHTFLYYIKQCLAFSKYLQKKQISEFKSAERATRPLHHDETVSLIPEEQKRGSLDLQTPDTAEGGGKIGVWILHFE